MGMDTGVLLVLELAMTGDWTKPERVDCDLSLLRGLRVMDVGSLFGNHTLPCADTMQQAMP